MSHIYFSVFSSFVFGVAVFHMPGLLLRRTLFCDAGRVSDMRCPAEPPRLDGFGEELPFFTKNKKKKAH